MPEWMPIETCPITPFGGTGLAGSERVLLAIRGGRFVAIGRYSYTSKGKGRWRDDSCYALGNPTHWMPLPSPPE